ncbi:hypothetical protein [Acinetobacter sp. WCHAc010052]|uniref:hypothetical protein n=1 Tax=Acinetobacter sp. WCHAc010052 TaxID=2004647 RepID=UPI000B3CA4BD|nr:hypothetical protein [Acinetobacter sp. WCHAc010052]AXY60626.1 hypothetical protein CDG61_11680 [Acinetobacter sp. WCHAc010052]
MSVSHFLEFDSFDNPTQLNKIGNWVITFLSPSDSVAPVQLGITSVLPRQISDSIQPSRITIQSTNDDNQWLIQQIECYEGHNGKECFFTAEDQTGQDILVALIHELKKYDVNVQLI